MLKKVSIILLVLLLISCSNINSSQNATISTAQEQLSETISKTQEQLHETPKAEAGTSSVEIKQSKLNQMINSEYLITDPVIVPIDHFAAMNYLFLVKEGAMYFSDGGDYWCEYALLGGACDTYESGKAYYDEINSRYKKTQLVSNYEEIEDRYGKGYMQQFYDRNITAFSVDGEQVLLKTYIAPLRTDKVLYEVFRGSQILNLYIFKDVVHLSLYNYTADLRPISIDESDVPKTDKGSFVAEEKKIYSLTRTTDINDQVYYKLVKDNDLNECIVYICLYSIQTDELVFKSEPVKNYPDDIYLSRVYPGYVALLDNKLIVGYYSKAIKPENQKFYMDYMDYFEIDIKTNEVNYLCTNGKGSFSPDGKYLAYAPQNYEGQEVQQGYYIYCIETGETAFISNGKTGMSSFEENDNNIICWAHKDGLASLLEQ